MNPEISCHDVDISLQRPIGDLNTELVLITDFDF